MRKPSQPAVGERFNEDGSIASLAGGFNEDGSASLTLSVKCFNWDGSDTVLMAGAGDGWLSDGSDTVGLVEDSVGTSFRDGGLGSVAVSDTASPLGALSLGAWVLVASPLGASMVGRLTLGASTPGASMLGCSVLGAWPLLVASPLGALPLGASALGFSLLVSWTLGCSLIVASNTLASMRRRC